MAVYKALILNKEISVNYEPDQKEQLEKAIEAINLKIKSYDNLNGKISDNKILSFLAIKLQAEILDFTNSKQKNLNVEKKILETNNENINLNDKLRILGEENLLLKKENEKIKNEIDELINQIDIISDILKET
tara:strand:+ start:1540 stop:1938 length:399 start_codon:yes stop_codon:yes gene_type:complete